MLSKRDLANWHHTENNDGLLYFVQRTIEMLFHYSNDSHKVPIMNTHLLVHEYFDVHRGIKSGSIKSDKYLDIVFEEFVLAFSKDCVLKSILNNEEHEYFIKRFGGMGKEEKYKTLEYIDGLMNDTYFTKCKELLNIAVVEKKKKEIEHLSRIFLSELIGRGYSQSSIYHRIKFKYLNQAIDDSSIETFDSFLNDFDFEIKKYTVYFSVHREILRLKEILSKRLSVKFDDDGNYDKFKIDAEHVKIHLLEVKALDEVSAVQKSYKRINVFLDYYDFFSNKRNISISDTAMVKIDAEDRTAFIDYSQGGLNITRDYDDEHAIGTALHILDRIYFSNVNNVGFFHDTISIHNTAIDDDNSENAFIKLWSIVEKIIPDNQNRNRIESIIETYKPVIYSSYIFNLFQDIVRIIKRWDNNLFRELIEQIDNEGNEINKISAFILCDEYAPLREWFYTNTVLFPLIKNRVFIMNKNLNTVGKLNTHVNAHMERFCWHMYRIYRMRNSIVHDAKASIYVRPLGEHLHNYVDDLICEVFIAMTDKPFITSIDSALIELKKGVDIWQKKYSDSSLRIDKSNVNEIVWHKCL